MSRPAPIYNRLALIGVGLIGSSIARAARAQGAVGSIVARFGRCRWIEQRTGAAPARSALLPPGLDCLDVSADFVALTNVEMGLSH